mmetsp:Transcript_41920/g.98296  ORF Transcript_41920/g.98296 Transcript_41920/m.98296 type:complete len:251 (-) Transcript_41920:717-1469(-)
MVAMLSLGARALRALTAACCTAASGSPRLADVASVANMFAAYPIPPSQRIPMALTASALTKPRRSASSSACASWTTARSLSDSGILDIVFASLLILAGGLLLLLDTLDTDVTELRLDLASALGDAMLPTDPLRGLLLLDEATELRAGPGVLVVARFCNCRFFLSALGGVLGISITGGASKEPSRTNAWMAALLTCHCGSRSIAPTTSTSFAPLPTSPSAWTAAQRTAGESSFNHFRASWTAVASPRGTNC